MPLLEVDEAQTTVVAVSMLEKIMTRPPPVAVPVANEVCRCPGTWLHRPSAENHAAEAGRADRCAVVWATAARCADVEVRVFKRLASHEAVTHAYMAAAQRHMESMGIQEANATEAMFAKSDQTLSPETKRLRAS